MQPSFGVAAPRSWSGHGSLTIGEQPPGLFETAADIYDDIDVYNIDSCFFLWSSPSTSTTTFFDLVDSD